jgi:hypothetical protein
MKEGSNVPADLLLLVRWVTDPRLCDFSFAALVLVRAPALD